MGSGLIVLHTAGFCFVLCIYTATALNSFLDKRAWEASECIAWVRKYLKIHGRHLELSHLVMIPSHRKRVRVVHRKQQVECAIYRYLKKKKKKKRGGSTQSTFFFFFFFFFC